MNDLLTPSIHGTTPRNPSSFQCYQIPISPSGSSAQIVNTVSFPTNILLVTTVADSTENRWVTTTFRSERPSLTEAGFSESSKVPFQEPLTRFLEQIERDLADLPWALRGTPCFDRCRMFVNTFGRELASVIGSRHAIFGDEEDGIELVVHSNHSKRQVTFEFDKAVETVTIVRIDEVMHRSLTTCRIDHILQLGNAIAWLNKN